MIFDEVKIINFLFCTNISGDTCKNHCLTPNYEGLFLCCVQRVLYRLNSYIYVCIHEYLHIYIYIYMVTIHPELTLCIMCSRNPNSPFGIWGIAVSAQYVEKTFTPSKLSCCHCQRDHSLRVLFSTPNPIPLICVYHYAYTTLSQW